MNFEKQLLESVSNIPHIRSKALANFIFREVIEDAHSKYKISQDDMKNMCQEAVNRCFLYLSIQGTILEKGFDIFGYDSAKWNDPNPDKIYIEKFEEILLNAVSDKNP